MIPDIIELNFPKKDGKQYATLTHASIPQADMGEKTITTQVKIDGEIVPDFSFDWEVEFQGEKYIMPLRIPAGLKDNEKLKSQIDLTFQHWAIYQLKRWPFVTIQQIAAGTYLPDEEVATVQLNLKDFCILFGQVLEYYYGGAITIDLNPAWQYKQEATIITISHTKIWNVLIDAFHDKYGVRWEIKAASDNSNTVKGGERYVIRVGYPTTEVDHIFEYGFEGGLLKVERQVQSEEIRNMLKGRGGETNIPFRYFKNTDPNNPDFRPDPDWVEELRDIYFPNLMPATFRSYVQGWKAAHISKYPGYTAVGESNTYAPWAYRKGYTDTKFQPVEFVADEITINPATGDKQVEILPGYAPYVKKGSSLDKYGPLPDTLDNNAAIYPTLQGTGLDIAVDVEQVTTDDVESEELKRAQLSSAPSSSTTAYAVPDWTEVVLFSNRFHVEEGKTATLLPNAIELSIPGMRHEGEDVVYNMVEKEEIVQTKIVNFAEQKEVNPDSIPGGYWNYQIKVKIRSKTGDIVPGVCVSCNSPLLIVSDKTESWKETFDIWIQNVWDSSKFSTETDAQYAERVWKPVLGDREGNEAAVMFTSGALVHEDYEFKIPEGTWPVYDTSKEWTDAAGTVHTSHWRITLAKSDAELETTGLYVPSTQKQGKAGDTFVFIGTEMMHNPYVTDAEKRLDDWKKDQLGEKKEIKPTAVVTTDRVRLNNEGKPNALINQLRVGNSLRLFDKRFFNEEGKAYETLYLQSITYTYREPTSDDAALNPDVEIVLGNEYATSANPVSMMQGEISALQQQLGSISNIEQIVRAVGDKLYLRKDGISDRSLSPTQFFSLLTSGDFKKGTQTGDGWGFYRDENGNWTLEVPRVVIRQDMRVNNLVVNQTEAKGGTQIETAAYIKCTNVVETPDSYICYFDQKGGTVANLFKVGDVAYCNRWTPENKQLKFYKRKVTAVDIDSITLSKSISNGTGVPEIEDNIIHFGNYTDPARQYVKIRDVVGGGYEQYIEDLDSVNAVGREYYFVGRMTGQYNDRPRFFLGDAGNFIEYKNGKLLINGTLTVGAELEGGGTIADKFNGIDTSIEEAHNTASSAQNTADAALQAAGDANSLANSLQSLYNSLNDIIIPDLQNQIDGAIESWSGTAVPTLSNAPASGWTTETEKDRHIGDYYDREITSSNGETSYERYKFTKTGGTYSWKLIADDGGAKALAEAQKALGIANGKNKVIYQTAKPEAPYNIDDLWIKTDTGVMYISNADRAEGAVVGANDWSVVNDTSLRLRQMSSDNVISKEEKASLRNEWTQIQEEYAAYQSDATTYGVSITALANAYNTLNTVLTGTAAINSDSDTTLTASQRNSYNNAFASWQSEVSRFSNAVAQKKADDAAAGVALRTENMLPKRYLLDWNRITQNTCKRGSDADGNYYSINENSVYIIGGRTGYKDIFKGKIKYKPATQYVLSVRWKMRAAQLYSGLNLGFIYSDGTRSEWIALSGSHMTLTTKSLISEKGKTVTGICTTHGESLQYTSIYDIQLVEGDKALPGWLEAPQDRIIPERNILPADKSAEVIADSSTASKYAVLTPAVSIEANEDYILSVDSIVLEDTNLDDNDEWIKNPYCYIGLYKNGIFYAEANFSIAGYPQHTHWAIRHDIPSGCQLFLYPWKGYSTTVQNRVVFSGVRLAKGTVFPVLDAENRYDNTKTTIDGGIVTSGTLQVAGNKAKVRAGITGKAMSANPDAATEAYNDEAVRFWAGEEFKNRETAPARILDNGEAYFSKCYSFFPAFEINAGNMSACIKDNGINLDYTGAKIFLNKGLDNFFISLPKDPKYIGSVVEIYNPYRYQAATCDSILPVNVCTKGDMFGESPNPYPSNGSPVSGQYYALNIRMQRYTSAAWAATSPKWASFSYSVCVIDTKKYAYLKIECIAMSPFRVNTASNGNLGTNVLYSFPYAPPVTISGTDSENYHAIWVVSEYILK